MILLITGGSGSGKSEYAERRVKESGLPARYYLATMEVWGQEEQKKVERHRRLRRGKGFQTLEIPRHLEETEIHTEPSRTAILLECVTNLAANELFGPGQDWERMPEEQKEQLLLEAETRIMEGICSLERQCALLVIVTGQVGQDGGDYDAGTRSYIRLLGEVNCRIAAIAQEMVEVVVGIPLILSGKERSGQ